MGVESQEKLQENKLELPEIYLLKSAQYLATAGEL